MINKKDIEEFKAAKKGKVCTKCGKFRPLTDYFKNKEKIDGLFNSCKACEREKTKLYRKNNREKWLSYRRADYQKNIERERKRVKEYYTKIRKTPEYVRWDAREENKLRVQKKKREWSAKNKTKIKQYQKTTKKNYPDSHSARKMARQARRRGNLPPIPSKCSINNENCKGRIEGHHDSYKRKDKLILTYYCRRHHAAWHRVFLPERDAVSRDYFYQLKGKKAA